MRWNRDRLPSILASAISLAALVADDISRRGVGRGVHPPGDVVYGRKYGTALTLDVFTPKENANGAAIVWVVSGGWFSAHEAINPCAVDELLKRGYTVFAVVHGSQPRYTIPEIVADMNRAVRFIRYHAADYHIDPDRIGITGGSAGGHLSLMQGTAGDKGNPDAKDPIDKTSSRVQAVACFFPPTDFLNYGKPGENAIGRGILKGFKPPFDFHEQDPRHQGLPADHRRGANPRDRPPDQPGLSCLGRRSSHADHARRRRPARADPAGRADHRQAQGRRRRVQARRQERRKPRLARPAQGHDHHRRLV